MSSLRQPNCRLSSTACRTNCVVNSKLLRDTSSVCTTIVIHWIQHLFHVSQHWVTFCEDCKNESIHCQRVLVSSVIHWQARLAVCCCLALTHTHNRFTALFAGLPGWSSARRRSLDFMVRGAREDNRGVLHCLVCQSTLLCMATWLDRWRYVCQQGSMSTHHLVNRSPLVVTRSAGRPRND